MHLETCLQVLSPAVLFVQSKDDDLAISIPEIRPSRNISKSANIRTSISTVHLLIRTEMFLEIVQQASGFLLERLDPDQNAPNRPTKDAIGKSILEMEKPKSATSHCISLHSRTTSLKIMQHLVKMSCPLKMVQNTWSVFILGLSIYLSPSFQTPSGLCLYIICFSLVSHWFMSIPLVLIQTSSAGRSSRPSRS